MRAQLGAVAAVGARRRARDPAGGLALPPAHRRAARLLHSGRIAVQAVESAHSPGLSSRRQLAAECASDLTVCTILTRHAVRQVGAPADHDGEAGAVRVIGCGPAIVLDRAQLPRVVLPRLRARRTIAVFLIDPSSCRSCTIVAGPSEKRCAQTLIGAPTYDEYSAEKQRRWYRRATR